MVLLRRQPVEDPLLPRARRVDHGRSFFTGETCCGTSRWCRRSWSACTSAGPRSPTSRSRRSSCSCSCCRRRVASSSRWLRRNRRIVDTLAHDERSCSGPLPQRLPVGRRHRQLPDRGGARRPAAATSVWDTFCHTRARCERRHRRRRLRPLRPGRRRRGDDGRPRPAGLPLLVRVAAGDARGPRHGRTPRASPSTTGWSTLLLDSDIEPVPDAVPLGPAAGARGQRRLPQPRHAPSWFADYAAAHGREFGDSVTSGRPSTSRGATPTSATRRRARAGPHATRRRRRGGAPRTAGPRPRAPGDALRARRAVARHRDQPVNGAREDAPAPEDAMRGASTRTHNRWWSRRRAARASTRSTCWTVRARSPRRVQPGDLDMIGQPLDWLGDQLLLRHPRHAAAPARGDDRMRRTPRHRTTERRSGRQAHHRHGLADHARGLRPRCSCG